MPPTSDVQPSNMSSDDVTLEVFQPVPTRMVVSCEQPLNMFSIFCTFEVFHPVRSSVVSLLQLANILSMLVMLSVRRFSMPLMSVRLVIPLNHEKPVEGYAVLNV